MSFRAEYGDVVLFNIMFVYNIEYDQDKLNRIHRELELIFDKIQRLNHNRFFNEGELFSVVKFLESHLLCIENETLMDLRLEELVEEIIENICDEITSVAENWGYYEMCGNIVKLKPLLIEKIKN